MHDISPGIKNSFVSSLLKTSVCGVYLIVQCSKSMNLRIFFLYKSYPSLFALNYTSCFKYILLFPVGASTEIFHRKLTNVGLSIPWHPFCRVLQQRAGSWKNTFVSSLLKTSVCGVYLIVQCPKSKNLRIFFLYKSYPPLFALNYTSLFENILLFPIGAGTEILGIRIFNDSAIVNYKLETAEGWRSFSKVTPEEITCGKLDWYLSL